MLFCTYVFISGMNLNNDYLKIIEDSKNQGPVKVGLLSDESLKNEMHMSFDVRKIMFESLGVETFMYDSNTIKQEILTNKPNLTIFERDLTGDERENIEEMLSPWNGTCKCISEYNDNVTGSVDVRRGKLKQLIKSKPYIRVMEASNGITGLIVEKEKHIDENTKEVKEFDAMWVSSLCDSTFKGKPDIELVDFTSRINTIHEIMEVTTKPIILDGDTGGKIEHFVFNVKTLERIGVSAVIIEDKIGLKKNSLFGTDVKQTLDDPYEFAKKIIAGKSATKSGDFMIFARIESLIAGYGIDDALKRAKIYECAGADGIMIHSKEKDGSEIMEFLKSFKKISNLPVILVPTSYNSFTEEELHGFGANVIIYANHLLRSAYPAMKKTANMILQTGRSKDVDEYCMSIKEILHLIPGGK